MDLYIVTIVLVGCLGAASVLALALGLLGAAGIARIARCPQCGHLIVLTGADPNATCPYCRHEHLAHPVVTLRHLRSLLTRR